MKIEMTGDELLSMVRLWANNRFEPEQVREAFIVVHQLDGPKYHKFSNVTLELEIKGK